MIHTLVPNVTKEAALSELDSRGLRRLLQGPLRKLAEVHIPFQLFRISVADAIVNSEVLLAIDLVRGTLDPYSFDTQPELSACAAKNPLPAKLSETDAAEIALTQGQRLLFSKGFFRLRNPKISVEAVGDVFYVPYWVAFYGAGEQATFTVLDAVRRRVEGNKVRTLIRDWLTGTN